MATKPPTSIFHLEKNGGKQLVSSMKFHLICSPPLPKCWLKMGHKAAFIFVNLSQLSYHGYHWSHLVGSSDGTKRNHMICEVPGIHMIGVSSYIYVI